MSVLRDPPILAFMVAQTLIWAAIFYSFPALVLHWQQDFGWSATAAMGAFSVALALQGLAAPSVGRLIDRGFAPRGFPIGAVGAVVGLVALTQVQGLWGFYAVWAWLGVMMGFTLYDACFAIVTRARGASARQAITAITLVAGFASTIAYPLTAAVTEAAGWRAAVWVLAGLVLVLNIPLATFAARRLEAEARDRTPVQPAQTQSKGRSPFARAEFWPLGIGFAFGALGTGILLSHLLPLMASLGVVDAMAILAASLIGPAQVSGRIILTLAGARVQARHLSQAAFILLALASLALAGAAAFPWLVLAFAVGQGLGYGVISILRPVVTRDVMGDAGFGESAGAVARLSLFSFALAPGLGAILVDLAGYGAVIALCVLAPLAGVVSLRRLRVAP
ncbi:MFS transporter [Roseibacterium beibuensis]|uniref:Arsenite efflux MFS transporter ArsK n=1 Tax=[Roseibacterium] beibuensis TaxID=1193142 RepID=A0ABP9LCC0_9RHOB|nr:MFS transporter [Roseibacterium beibuensis]MCS6624312.1 MFS transporter [Roseibacterium beibuensis]